MAFWITYYMKAKREQKKKEQMVIKLFSRNYARDLVNNNLLPLFVIYQLFFTYYELNFN